MKKSTIAILVGTRPEIIKMAPVMRQLTKQKMPFIFIHSNQHYTKEMDENIIADLKLKKPDYQLQVGSGTHAVQTGKIMEGVEKICLERKISVMLVHGDTNTTLAGALAAKKLHIKVGHIEAGLRSFDYRMPEEINRILTDRISDVLFAPTKLAKKNLQNEGIKSKTIVITGNTAADSLYQHLEISKKQNILKKHALVSNGFILLTLHRAENVDEKKRFLKMIKLINHVSKKLKIPVIWPIHPRSRKQLTAFTITLSNNITIIDPVGYLDMIQLISNSAMVLTDSGGIQEEAYILQRPLITLRDSTERPETLSANFIVDVDLKKVTEALAAYQQNQVTWKNEFGDGTASVTIAKTLQNILEQEQK